MISVLRYRLYDADTVIGRSAAHGVLTLGGVGSLVLGSALLFNSGPGGVGVDPWVIAGAAIVSLLFFGFIVRK